MKKIDAEKQPGLMALKKKRPDVTKKMGFMKKGGSPKKNDGWWHDGLHGWWFTKGRKRY